MREGVKIVVGIMVALIIAFALIYIFSERIMGTDENIMQPREKETGITLTTEMCRMAHGTNPFLVEGDSSGTCDQTDCGEEYLRDTVGAGCTDDTSTTPDKCCCKCK